MSLRGVIVGFLRLFVRFGRMLVPSHIISLFVMLGCDLMSFRREFVLHGGFHVFVFRHKFQISAL